MADQTNVDSKSIADIGPEAERHRVPMILAVQTKVGDSCPVCNAGQLDYDGLLNLSCPVCGFSLAGCFT